jgi:predicted methyltransferase
MLHLQPIQALRVFHTAQNPFGGRQLGGGLQEVVRTSPNGATRALGIREMHGCPAAAGARCSNRAVARYADRLDGHAGYAVDELVMRIGFTGATETKSLHRIEEKVVRDEIARAGFKLAAEGTFLRNPKDRGTGTPAPTDGDRRRGTTDRFVLKFVKP